VPARVEALAFTPSRSQRRIAKKNADLTAEVKACRVTEEQYRLFHRYLEARHGDGEMAGMTARDFQEMVGASPVQTNLVEFRDAGGRLLAGLLCDRLEDGLSLVYSFFEPEEAYRSLGAQMILWAIGEAQRLGLPYVYLGYWIAESPKMAYKASFKPLQLLRGRKWRRL
jgi:arginine-tRNA-protein transferase